MDNTDEIFPARQSWSQAVSDISTTNKNVVELRLISKVKGITKLSQLSKLKRLWCFDVNEDFFDKICKCTSLEELFIENLKTNEIEKLQLLTSLTVLSIERCNKLENLASFSMLKHLKALRIESLKNVTDMSPLVNLPNLEVLVVAGGMESSSRMKVSTFSPLSHLKKLKYLHLTNIKALDNSLEPLGTLTNLIRLDLANFYPTEEFAKLSRKLPSTKSTWFSPYIDIPYTNCKKCQKKTMVMLSGSSKPSLCKECDKEKLNAHIEKFQMIANGLSS